MLYTEGMQIAVERGPVRPLLSQSRDPFSTIDQQSPREGDSESDIEICKG